MDPDRLAAVCATVAPSRPGPGPSASCSCWMRATRPRRCSSSSTAARSRSPWTARRPRGSIPDGRRAPLAAAGAARGAGERDHRRRRTRASSPRRSGASSSWRTPCWRSRAPSAAAPWRTATFPTADPRDAAHARGARGGGRRDRAGRAPLHAARRVGLSRRPPRRSRKKRSSKANARASASGSVSARTSSVISQPGNARSTSARSAPRGSGPRRRGAKQSSTIGGVAGADRVDLAAHRLALRRREAVEGAGVEHEPEARADVRLVQRGHVAVDEPQLDAGGRDPVAGAVAAPARRGRRPSPASRGGRAGRPRRRCRSRGRAPRRRADRRRSPRARRARSSASANGGCSARSSHGWKPRR